MNAKRCCRSWLWAGVITALLCECASRAVEVPLDFTVETLATNLNAPTAIVLVLDGRILIADQTGPLRVWKSGRLLKAPALDLTGRVDDYWERGLVGATLHPDFPQTPYLYVVYVAKQPFVHHVVSRFTMLGDRADPASELVLLEGDDQKTLGGTIPHGHQGGPIRFGADGKLYISIGEQTAGQPAQSLTTLQGKILRINADGSVPNNNPFFTRTTGKYRAIWAYGIRNAFGLVVQPKTGRMFFTDVGGSAFEEVNELLRGGNYGWPQAEGFSSNTTFKNPLYAYPPVIGRSIVGAAFCPEPGLWARKFFFADWAANWIKALDPDNPTNVVTFAKGLDAPVALEFAPDGSLLVLNRGTLWREGKKWRPNSGSLLRITTGQSAAQPHAFPRTFEPANSFVEFQLIHPPWRPGVVTRHRMSMAPGERLRINREREFEFPAGTIIVEEHVAEKTGAIFETHVFWFTDNRIARAAAYRADGTLIEDGEVISLPGDPAHKWFSPGTEERLNVDAAVVGFLLPLSPRQLTREQLAKWQLPDGPRLAALNDATASHEHRVRSYLDVNCAGCHRPGGPSRGNFDARFVAGEKLTSADLVAGDLGIAGARLVVRGHPEKSVLLQRVIREDAFRMPPISLNEDPNPIIPLLREWIATF